MINRSVNGQSSFQRTTDIGSHGGGIERLFSGLAMEISGLADEQTGKLGY
jgi:hypothetical protein